MRRSSFAPTGSTFVRLPGALALLLLLAAPALALPAAAETLKGKLVLVEKGKVQSSREARNSIVWWQPRTPVKVQPAAAPLEMTTVRKEFLPRVLAVPAGSRVRFPNQDPILHNVFSVSGENRFDLGLYKQGEAKEALLRQPGIVNVFCNVHHSMVGYIAVLETPFYTSADGDGVFELKNLPAGPGTLTLWQERTEPKTIELTLPQAGAPLEVRLEVTKARVPPHRNKFGQPYERQRGKAY
jgi:plastocyanin